MCVYVCWIAIGLSERIVFASFLVKCNVEEIYDLQINLGRNFNLISSRQV